MYVIRNDLRKAYKTFDGWTTITRKGNTGVLNGLNDVQRFTEGESQRMVLPKGSRFVYFPKREWRDLK